ncbi:MAG TPA: ParB/RepB/Spo0J family partition protein [Gemmatimonadaceae bacterium]|nr:ParB/RepB/Spo0J family partition protein [Gemmatimonadaceae bacterium]
MTSEKPRRLGRGLEALLSARAVPEEPDVRPSTRTIAITQIRANPFQPRKTFDPEEIAKLEASLRSSGLLQPITVRPAPSGSGYELIAGERRLRAATGIGWTEIPAVVKNVDDRTLLTLALIENLQRADLDPIEEALGYQRLINEFELTQQQVAEVIGKDRSTVANLLRLLNLPASVQRLLQERKLSAGHARALLAAGSEEEMLQLAQEAATHGLTVRDVERRTRPVSPSSSGPATRARVSANGDADTREARRITEELRRHLQTDVRIAVTGNGRGTIHISFYSADDLERLLELVLGSKRDLHV